MALVTGGVHGDRALVPYIGRPMPIEGVLYPVHIQFFGQFAADLADDLKIGQAFGAQVDTAEELPVDIPVELFHELAVGTSRVVLQEHQGQFALTGKQGTWALSSFLETKGRYQIVPGDRHMDLAKVAIHKAGVKGIELFLLGGK